MGTSVPAGWTAFNTFNNNALSVSKCGNYGPILGGFQQLGVDALLTRCFDTTKAHTEVIIELELVAIDSFDNEMIMMLVDGVQVSFIRKDVQAAVDS